MIALNRSKPFLDEIHFWKTFEVGITGHDTCIVQFGRREYHGVGRRKFVGSACFCCQNGNVGVKRDDLTKL